MIEFIKMEATGNDYIYIDCFKNDIRKISELKQIVIKMCNRNFGIGSDGLILICPSEIADAKMVMYNIDGSEGNMCGNGIRCVAKYVYENIINKQNVIIETKSGLKQINLNIQNGNIIDITVNMEKPVFNPDLIPVITEKKMLLNEMINISGNVYYITCLSMGNPHTVIFFEEIDNLDLDEIGKKIENNDIFPDRTNVEFVQIINKNKIKIRVWERGCGETLSCGTGACASVVAGILNGYLDSNEIEVNLKGGTLYIKYENEVIMRGPANNVYYGKYIIKDSTSIDIDLK